jgi:cellulose synthase/poly-beta-1,6-N-acetylglucosamine synthase-like glycosyltransferase
MVDYVMQAGIYVFAILFFFIAFVFITSVSAVFIRKKYEDYEPDVSILVPCYNEEKTIARCLNAIFSLNYPKNKTEVIVINDGSTDRTEKILAEFKKRFNIQVINGNHEGKACSLNKALTKASYDIIFTVDADTFVDQNSLRRLVRPFNDKRVGATNGSWTVEENSLLNVMQKIEFHYNNLVRKGFSKLFGNGIWFFGSFACYRKDVLKKINGFSKTLTEDMDIALRIYNAGYKTINIHNALGKTLLHGDFSQFCKQRTRWWAGGLQALHNNKSLFSLKSNVSVLFLFVSQYWWTFFALASLFLIGYQVNYWMPYNSQSFGSLFMYIFRWFSLLGPVYVIYKIPVWGISLYSFFGVLSGILSAFLIVWGLYSFNDKLNLKNAIGIFFYFPYTILLSFIVAASLAKIIFLKRGYFID